MSAAPAAPAEAAAPAKQQGRRGNGRKRMRAGSEHWVHVWSTCTAGANREGMGGPQSLTRMNVQFVRATWLAGRRLREILLRFPVGVNPTASTRLGMCVHNTRSAGIARRSDGARIPRARQQLISFVVTSINQYRRAYWTCAPEEGARSRVAVSGLCFGERSAAARRRGRTALESRQWFGTR
jgi:hypothetical protein